ncbi:FAS1 domain-containing protein [Senna tora]|uniref:FAS1 domain-containing protein n=1 Tax=Senna tora TaxID=362788 RepID=A0A834WMS6_9FABA|nr:FAS1 domain-containing protein [Senna tora]
MASNLLLVAFLCMIMMLLSSAIPAEKQNQDLVAAIEEMQRANYFTFVMLINMSPPDTRLEGNVTFLMPNDRMLAKMAMPEGSVSGFLLQHSIPSPLLFGTLEKFPTGTTIPSSLPNFMLRITNNGRKDFSVNNVKIISPNLCVAGSSIRCHGINGILSEADMSVNNSTAPPSSSCPNSTCRASSPSPSSPPSNYTQNLIPPPTTTLTAPTPTEADFGVQKSGSSHSINFPACLMLTIVMLNKKQFPDTNSVLFINLVHHLKKEQKNSRL